MTDEPRGDQNIHADENSIAFGSIRVGGNTGDIRIGHTIGFTSDQVSTLLTQISTTFQPKPFDGRCPYKGLDYFEESDADMFFGREKLVTDLVSRVQESRTLFITGPSGSGKSSLGRAGLMHALKQGGLPGSEKWLYATMKPGREPITTLAQAVAGLVMSTNAEDEIRARAMNDETIFTRWCEIALQDGRDKRVVLYVDQFEEVFTQVSKEEERIAFLDLLTHSASVENGRVILSFSMRSDFIPNCATYPRLNALLNRQFVQIGSMQQDELVSAIAQPALRVGLKIDPDLIAQIINDMHGEPGALPLMQFALKDLFDAQQEKGGLITLTFSDYLQRGGIHKALERHADKTFSQLSENEQELARSIFTGLIEIGRGTQDTRRTAVFQELVPASQRSTDVEAIVQKLADARLITTDEVAGKDTVTISHEKLIDAWPWLKKLVNENRDVIALQNEIADDAKEWDVHQRDASYLYAGARLAMAREKMAARQLMLSGLARDFIEQGIAVQEAERKAKETLRSRITFGLSLGTAVALALAAFGFFQASRATKQAVISHSQVLAVNAQKNESAVQENLLLSIEAYRLVERFSYSDRIVSEQTLRDSLGRVSGLPLSGHEGPIPTLVFSPDGRWLATGSDDRTVRLWKAKDPSAESIVLHGHTDRISTLAFSPDAEWLATGSYDNSARLWSVKDPAAGPIVLSGHESFISSVVFSPDGNWLATSSDDGTARLWSVKDIYAEPIILSGHIGRISILAFSPDGEWLATGSWDNTARLWNVKDPAADPIVLRGHGWPIFSLAFSPDGAWLATGSNDHTVRLWNVKDPSTEAIVLPGHESLISTSLAFSPDGAWLATSSSDNTVRLWNVKDISAEPIVLHGHESVISTLAFSPDAEWLATGSSDYTARLWSIEKPNARPIILRGHESGITTLAFSPDGAWLATGSSDTTARLWSIRNTPAEPIILRGHAGDITAQVFSPDGNWLATASFDTTARLWNAKDISADPIILRGHEGRIYTLNFSSDGEWLATGSDDNTARLWSIKNPTSEAIVLRGHESTISTLAFSPDGAWLATGSYDKTVRLWNVKDRSAEPIVMRGHEGEITTLAFSPDGAWLATGSNDATARLWNSENISADPIVLNRHKSFITTLAFSPDGAWLATGSNDYVVGLWNVKDPYADPIGLRGHEGLITTLAFSPNGEWLATGSWDNTARLWNVKNPPAKPIVMHGHEFLISSLAFSPDGEWMATSSSDATARLWNLENLSVEPIVLHGHEDEIFTLAFSPDGAWLATGSSDATARLWNLNKIAVMEKACQVVGRNFTRIEWTTFFPDEEYRKTCEQWSLEPEPTIPPTATP